ncbi:dienelactone hydrolase family protein [Glaciihabitans sp. INWT7]|uniref:dienelactone hydrolase family protein n=1 Tax=Glaciihabitans sp. INWT7 TaxID=2596912 RepID=UPI0016295CDE|nr:dienelactone hydrolase family protein [Glaciihabitans sp. INWT7]QNE48214.1 dienelactone hydrolase family protein [Glaciihabitans sp. INWT7]
MSQLVPIPSPGIPLAYGDRGRPLVLLLHDWYGRLPWLANYASALSSQGYRVIVPDLYNGVATVEAATAEVLMAQLDVAGALAELDGIIQVARTEGSTRVGVVGFSLGGWLALLHAQSGEADAVVAYYATLGPAQHGVIPAPVLLHLAEIDDWDEGEDPESFIDRLKDHGTPITEWTYLATVHSFANATITDRTDVNAAALAFARTSAFLEDHLLD